MNDIVTLIKVYEDEFDSIHELGKLELFDDLQGNEGQKERIYGPSSDAVIKVISNTKTIVSSQ